MTNLYVEENKNSDIIIELSSSNIIEVDLLTENNLEVDLSDESSLEVDLSIGKGEPGYTPIKGIDYFTKEDIEGLKDIFALKDHTHDGITPPMAKKAICGEFLCNELKVGEGLNVEARNGEKWIDNVTPVNALNMNAIENRLKEHQKALDELLYKDLVINLSSNKPGTLEKGTIVNEVVFNWNYSKDIISQSFNGNALEPNLRAYTYTTPFSSNKSFTLKANDGKKDFSRSISFSFLNGRYWGVSSSTQYDSSFILSLSKELSSSRSKTFTVNCGPGQYIYYCVPTSFGNCNFKVGGFDGGFSKVATIAFTNASGYSESYNIYKSTNSNLGNTTVVVS